MTFPTLDLINVRKQEITRLKNEAEKLRAQADTSCYKGTTKREYGFEAASRKFIKEGRISEQMNRNIM